MPPFLEGCKNSPQAVVVLERIQSRILVTYLMRNRIRRRVLHDCRISVLKIVDNFKSRLTSPFKKSYVYVPNMRSR